MHLRRSRRVKIIATLGPASADRETVAALLAAGADVFRINMSHASHDAMRGRVAMIRALEEEAGRPIGVLVDLQGPKLRLGLFADGGAELHKGDVFVLDGDAQSGDAARVQLPHPEILSSLSPGHRILVDDGSQRSLQGEGRRRGTRRRRRFGVRGAGRRRRDEIRPRDGQRAPGSVSCTVQFFASLPVSTSKKPVRS